MTKTSSKLSSTPQPKDQKSTVSESSSVENAAAVGIAVMPADSDSASAVMMHVVMPGEVVIASEAQYTTELVVLDYNAVEK